MSFSHVKSSMSFQRTLTFTECLLRVSHYSKYFTSTILTITPLGPFYCERTEGQGGSVSGPGHTAGESCSRIQLSQFSRLHCGSEHPGH